MSQEKSAENHDSDRLDDEAILEGIQGGTGDLNVNAHVHGTPTLSSYLFRTTRTFTTSNGDLNIDSNIS
jgi:hypothetical protein